MNGIDWTEVQTVIRVAKLGSLSSAARELKVNHSTILRRIQSFEDKHHVNVFVRDTKGYRLSRHGRALLQDFDTIDHQMQSLQRRIVDYDAQLQGKLTVTSTENIFATYLKQPLFEFARLFPGVELDLLISNQLVELTQLEADIAIRPMSGLPTGHIGYKLLDLTFYFYAPIDMIDSIALDKIGTTQNWIGYSGALAHARIGEILANKMITRPTLTANSFNGVAMAANAGLGLALLPSFMGDNQKNLQRLATKPIFETDVFAVAPADLAVSRRVNALLNFLQNCFEP